MRIEESAARVGVRQRVERVLYTRMYAATGCAGSRSSIGAFRQLKEIPTLQP